MISSLSWIEKLYWKIETSNILREEQRPQQPVTKTEGVNGRRFQQSGYDIRPHGILLRVNQHSSQCPHRRHVFKDPNRDHKAGHRSLS